MTEIIDPILEPPEPPTDLRQKLINKIITADRGKLLAVASVLKDVEEWPFYNVKHSCELLGISRATLYRRVAEGKLEPLPLGIKRTVFSAKEIFSYLREVKPEPPHEEASA